LVHQNAANVHSHEHWEILFTLMQGVGAAYYRSADDEVCFLKEIVKIMTFRKTPMKSMMKIGKFSHINYRTEKIKKHWEWLVFPIIVTL
jgi:hypothetical protein